MRIIDKEKPSYIGFNFLLCGKIEERCYLKLNYTRLVREKRQAKKVILNLFWELMCILFNEYDVT